MSSWRTAYTSKLTSAEEALRVVKSGNRVVLGHACGEPPALVDALVARAPVLRDVEINMIVPLGEERFAQPGMEESFRVNGFFIGLATRQTIADGRGDYTPCFFSEVPRLFKQKILPIDVALVQVTPPDDDGFCSYGLSADYTQAAVQYAPIVVAQINSKLPRTRGIRVHIDELTYIVEEDASIPEVKPVKVGEVERQVGAHIATLVPDGATLQIGIGAIPEAALLCLTDKSDLGVHSEMFSDGIVRLAEAGAITNRKKTIHTGKFVATFLMGTEKLYSFVDHNPDVELYPVDYVNDPFVIGQHEKMVSINSAIQVDLLGQVNAECIGCKQFSGVGGQIDFIRGAGRSIGGKSIIALPSTAAKGTISRICFELDRGAAVTTSRNDIHYVVTEYGIADLRGKTVRQRAEALIGISHPAFREELERELRQRTASALSRSASANI